MKILNKIYLIFLNLPALLPLKVLAQQPINTGLLDKAGQGAKYDTSINPDITIPQTVGTVIALLLSFVGAVFFILIIVSGIQWMTAGGSEEKIEKARTRMINATIGLAITMAAYFITWFISRILSGS